MFAYIWVQREYILFIISVDCLFQPVVAEINHAIGAEGVLSVECKEVVSQYGELIWDLLVSGVSVKIEYAFSLWYFSHLHVNSLNLNELDLIL